MKTSTNNSGWPGIFFIIPAIVMFIVVGYFAKENMDFIRGSVIVTGEIVEVQYKKRLNAPILSFKTTEGIPIKSRRTYAHPFELYHKGEKVPVRYLKSKPNSAKIANFWYEWAALAGLAAVAGLFFSAGLSMLFKNNKTAGILLCLSFLAMGFLLTKSAVYFYQEGQLFSQQSEKVKGIITGFHQKICENDDREYTCYAYIIDFITKTGTSITFRDGVYSSKKRVDKLNSQIDVGYRKGNPSNARVRGGFGEWGPPFILGLFGVLFLFFGAACLKGGMKPIIGN